MKQFYNSEQTAFESRPLTFANNKSGYKSVQVIVVVIMFLMASVSLKAQLGVFEFTGTGACPNQNPAVTTQPANAMFSDFSTVNATCSALTDQNESMDWNQGGTIDLSQYHEFTITADPNYLLNLSSLTFIESVSENGSGSGNGNTTWILRSSLDGYATDIATGSAYDNIQTPVVTLPSGSFSGLSNVTFRLYLINAKDNTTLWTIDDVTLGGTVAAIPADPANPTSNSPQCSNPGVILTANGTPPVGETWYWQATATGTSTANSGSTYVVTSSGTYYLRSQDNTTLTWSNGAGSVIVVVTPDVSVPTFSLGSTSTRCQGAEIITYSATATNSTGIVYSLDAASLAAGNTIDPSTGEVTYDAGWNGTSTITASADGCSGPKIATHTATTTASVGTPVFVLGSSSSRCKGAGSVTYSASATDATDITYSLDAASLSAGNTITSATGKVIFVAGWTGTSTITASATGCNGPQVSTHTVTTTASVGTPVFTMGSSSSRCQGTTTITYSASAVNSMGITYSLDAASVSGGNSIDPSTGDVTYASGWSGTSTITASAAGCNGPRISTHTVTITPSVGTPVFTMGSSSSRCQGSGTVTYNASATNATGITYSLDAASLAGGNSINTSNGKVTYVNGWNGTSIITATATGCNGPVSSTHTVTVTPSVGTPVFTLGSSSTRCLGSSTIIYDATASDATGITYSLDLASRLGGNTINASTGEVTFSAIWVGTSTITATANGCNGPKTATHTVTITAAVSTPVFVAGSSSTRCQAAGTVTYTANAANSSGITYSLDAASIAGGNTINSSTGAVTYAAGWSGTSVITASAAGCSGPKTATHTVTTTGLVAAPIFVLRSTSTRCQGAGSITYSADALNASGIVYSLDAGSISGGNSINSSTGKVTYVAGWSGTSTITANASGCGGPKISTHVVTTTPTVGTPVFTLGSASTRCQGTETVSYTANATSTTGITYSLDASSLAGGNTINSSTGAVTYAGAWNGTSIITASADGCSGPKTATHTVTTTPSVGLPVFSLGTASTRSQGTGTVTYSVTASNTTGITYSLDAASLAGGNTINASTGAVTYSSIWTGTSVITASAAGCNGPRIATHTVTINASSVIKQLYLSDPSQALDRVDPVNTGDATTASTAALSSTGTTSTTFTMNAALCSALTIKAGTITVKTYVTISSGSMPANPNMTAVLRYGATNIITLTNPVYKW